MRVDRHVALIAVAAALLGAAAAHADSVTLTWTAPGDDWNTGRAASYEVRYSESAVSADTASWWASATSIGSLPAPRTAGTRESFVVVGLAPGTTYYFAIRTRDEVPNVSGWSNIARKQTATVPVVLATPGNFQGESTPGAVLLTWTRVPAGGPEVGYRLYRKATVEPSPQLLATLPVAAVSWNDSTATSGTYDFSLAAYDDNGEGTPATVQVTVAGPTTVVAATQEVVHGYPNPARDQVTFRLNVDGASSTGNTRVTVFDLTGHKICLLADREFTAGQHSIPWACRSDEGYRVAPGIYNVIVEGPQGRAVTRVAIVP
ncbi:MAG TPA: fibronectin type III domain-containing protein [Candidatus Polarisedimenticolia bacterium]|nr:fibronectin type III domain-containing protein [Candidatus Polarisedimenticolia bacterium]